MNQSPSNKRKGTKRKQEQDDQQYEQQNYFIKPVVQAQVITLPHSDHYYNNIPFLCSFFSKFVNLKNFKSWEQLTKEIVEVERITINILDLLYKNILLKSENNKFPVEPEELMYLFCQRETQIKLSLVVYLYHRIMPCCNDMVYLTIFMDKIQLDHNLCIERVKGAKLVLENALEYDSLSLWSFLILINAWDIVPLQILNNSHFTESELPDLRIKFWWFIIEKKLVKIAAELFISAFSPLSSTKHNHEKEKSFYRKEDAFSYLAHKLQIPQQKDVIEYLFQNHWSDSLWKEWTRLTKNINKDININTNNNENQNDYNSGLFVSTSFDSFQLFSPIKFCQNLNLNNISPLKNKDPFNIVCSKDLSLLWDYSDDLSSSSSSSSPSLYSNEESLNYSISDLNCFDKIQDYNYDLNSIQNIPYLLPPLKSSTVKPISPLLTPLPQINSETEFSTILSEQFFHYDRWEYFVNEQAYFILNQLGTIYKLQLNLNNLSKNESSCLQKSFFNFYSKLIKDQVCILFNSLSPFNI